MIKTALIMAGGKGERFWPRSRQSLPKQFLSLTDDDKTMIQLTVGRISPIVDVENVYVVTNKDYKHLVKEQIPGIPMENIICEPIGRNTSPCIGLGAAHIKHKYPDEDVTMIVLPSDHLVKYNDVFVDTLSSACEIAEKGSNLVTIGITPNYPETGYGYIKYNEEKPEGKSFTVDSFVEKPDLDTAKKYLESGNYLWNSGMFIWKLSTINECYEKFLPEMYSSLNEIEKSIGTASEDETLNSIFPDLENISIDYGVMEKSDNIYIIPGNFGWDDVGSWLAVSRVNETDSDENIIRGNVVSLDVKNCIIEGSDKLIAAAGIEDLIVVDSGDALLIIPKEKAGDIKKLLAKMRENGMEKYL